MILCIIKQHKTKNSNNSVVNTIARNLIFKQCRDYTFDVSIFGTFLAFGNWQLVIYFPNMLENTWSLFFVLSVFIFKCLIWFQLFIPKYFKKCLSLKLLHNLLNQFCEVSFGYTHNHSSCTVIDLSSSVNESVSIIHNFICKAVMCVRQTAVNTEYAVKKIMSVYLSVLLYNTVFKDFDYSLPLLASHDGLETGNHDTPLLLF